MDGWMWMRSGKKGGRQALGRATQSRLQMCRQQQCGCFGPHQAALGVSPAHVPTLPVNQPSQASGSTTATKPIHPDPQNRPASDRQTPVTATFPPCLHEIGNVFHPFPSTPTTLFIRCVLVFRCSTKQRTVACRSQRDVARCPPGFSPPQRVCCSVSQSQWHQGIPSIAHTASHPLQHPQSVFTQLQIPAGCECV